MPSGQGTADSAQPLEGTADGAPCRGFPEPGDAGQRQGKDQSPGEIFRRNIGRLWETKRQVPNIENGYRRQQVETAAAIHPGTGAANFPTMDTEEINRISRVLFTWKNKKVSAAGSRMLNRSYHNQAAFWEEATSEFNLPQKPNHRTLSAIQYALAQELQRRKIWHQPMDSVRRIVSGIDGKIWIHGPKLLGTADREQRPHCRFPA